jgi:hypothetical protein
MLSEVRVLINSMRQKTILPLTAVINNPALG